MADKYELFTVIVTNRSEIADQLNTRIDLLGLTQEHPEYQLAQDDDRLTTAICKDHVSRLGELGRFYPDSYAIDADIEGSDSEHDDCLDDTLRALGFLPPEED